MGMEFIDVTYPLQKKKLDKMVKMFENIKMYSDSGAPNTMREEDRKLIKAAQDFAMYTRHMPANTGDPDWWRNKREIMKEAFDIKVELTPENWVKITLPTLPVSESKLSPWFIREPLDIALEDFFLPYQREHNGYVFRIQYSVIIFKHRYDRLTPECHMRDLDNIEVKGVLDSIAMFTMPDDDAKHCHIFSCMELADHAFTEVFVVPQSEFSQWIAKHYKVE